MGRLGCCFQYRASHPKLLWSLKSLFSPKCKGFYLWRDLGSNATDTVSVLLFRVLPFTRVSEMPDAFDSLSLFGGLQQVPASPVVRTPSGVPGSSSFLCTESVFADIPYLLLIFSIIFFLKDVHKPTPTHTVMTICILKNCLNI